jgi:ribosomal protein S18 acetylase RimI-like enzyme
MRVIAMEDIVQATSAADVASARELFEEYQRAIGVDLCFQGFAEELSALPGAYRPPAGRLLLARGPEGVLGCAALRPLADDIGEIKRLYVRPGARGRGLGKRLTQAIIGAARDVGYARLRLDTLPSMGLAIDLYRSLGFHAIPPYGGRRLPGALFFELPL